MKTAEPEKITIKYSVDFWMEELKAAGFEFERTYQGDSHYVWHRYGDFHVGFEREQRVIRDADLYRDFIFIQDGFNVPDTKFTIRCIMSAEYLDDFRTLLRAIRDPDLMPLMIGRKWAAKLVTFFLQRSAA